MGVSSACSVMETTRIPFRLSMDLKAMACSRLRVNLENFQTRITWKGALGWDPSSIILRNWGLSAMRPLSASSTYSRATGEVALLGVVTQRSHLGCYRQVHVLSDTGDPSVEGRWCGCWQAFLHVLVSHCLSLRR